MIGKNGLRPHDALSSTTSRAPAEGHADNGMVHTPGNQARLEQIGATGGIEGDDPEIRRILADQENLLVM